MSGLTSYHAGVAAEAAVERAYRRAGLKVRSRRWRGTGGEIDLIVQDGRGLIFVEVKKSRTRDAAALRLNRRQMHRIYSSASEFLAGEPMGQLTDARFDVALVDATGCVDVIENAFGH